MHLWGVCEMLRDFYAMARAGEIVGIYYPYEANPQPGNYHTPQKKVLKKALPKWSHLDLLGYLPPKPAPALNYVILKQVIYLTA